MTIPGTDIATYEGGQLDAYRPQIMTPEAAKALDEQVRQCTKAVLREGVDYGIIPGTGGEQVLFRPGAQKLLQWFGLSCTCERTDLERDDQGRKHGITYRATVTRRLPDGTETILATCEGTADYDESKFYQSAEQAQFKAEAKERAFAKKDGRPANPNKWKYVTEYRADWNALMKRAQKRAIVGAVIDATAAGGIFKVETDDYSETADGGPSWYQQALAWAATVTSKDDANSLWAETAQAKLSGAITADQATHVQNRIRQRMARLAPVQVEVEDLANNAAAASQTASPAQPPTPAAPAPPLVPQGAGEALDADPAVPDSTVPAAGAVTTLTTGQRKLIEHHIERLGYNGSEEDRKAALSAVAKLAGTRLIHLASLDGLDQDEAATVISELKKVSDVQELMELLQDGTVRDGQ